MITAGTIDTSFVIGDGFDNLVYPIKVSSDGKILVGGNFEEYNGNTTYYITRLNSDGTLDNTFDNGSYLTGNVRAIAIESDGKILAGGAFNSYNGTTTKLLVRLNTDGTLNTSYGNGFECDSCNTSTYNGNNIVRDIAVQTDGKILVGGYFNLYSGVNLNYIARLNYDGTIDNTFNIGSGFDNQVFSIEVLPNGNILVGGDFQNYNGITCNRIALLSPTGSLLNSFGNGFDDRVHKIVVQPDGKILCGGQFENFNGTTSLYMIRLTANGSIDNANFDFGDWVINMLVQNDGRIVVVGQFENFNGNSFNYIVRLNPSGSIDGSFYVDNGFDDDTNSLSLLQNGNILVGGKFNGYNGNSYNRIISLNNDELTYQYQYVYEVEGCSLNCDGPIVNLPIYYVGSDVELFNGDFISLYDINNPSFVQCGTIASETNIAAEPTHAYQSTQNDCETCLSNISVIAYCLPCNNPEEFGPPLPILVSNSYVVGDIVTIPETIFQGEGEYVIYFNDCFTIVDILPYESCEYFELPQVVNYQPKRSCEECTACLGRYYGYTDCEDTNESGLVYSHQNMNLGDVFLLQSGSSSCKQVESIESVIPIPLPLFQSETSGSPVINSTVIFSGCDECLNLSSIWTEEIVGNGYVDFNDPLPAPFPNWGIIGPDSNSCDPGWTYVKYQSTTSGILTFFYDFTTSTDLCCDWPFYYVSPNEPIGSTNINFSVAGSENVFGPNYATTPGEITISYNAGDWISIGVYSTDCIEGSGILFISEPQLIENPPYTLHNFTTCNGEQGYVSIPTSQEDRLINVTQIPYTEITSEGLDTMPSPGSPNCDDDFIEIPFPTDFRSDFLCGTYDSVYMGTNSYITFGAGSDSCCFNIPNEIPTGDGTGLPGVYISTSEGDSPLSGLDNMVINWYSGLTNGGNNFIIRYEGTYLNFGDEDTCECTDIENCPPLVYSFIFYKNVSNYFDLVIESNTYFYNNNPIGGVSDGINFNFLGTFYSTSQKSYRITTTCPIIKGNVGTTPAVCGTIGSSVTGLTQSTGIGGSIYFDGNIPAESRISINNDDGDFQFGPGNDLTIEWFQYWEGANNSARPFSIGTYPSDLYLEVSFEADGLFWVGNGAGLNSYYGMGLDLNTITNTWVHFAITRYYDSVNNIYTWRVFVNGVQVLSQENGFYALQNTTLPLIIGGQSNDDGLFQGNITNFRVNNISAIYPAGGFTPPTAPLGNIPGTILLLLSSNEPDLLTDTTGLQSVTPNGNVVWSTNNPFITQATAELFYSDANVTYTNCSDCNQLYGVTLRECTTGEIMYTTMNENSINNILSQGPIFGTLSPQCYELLNYCILPLGGSYTPSMFYSTCEICNQPFSAGTEVTICEELCDQSVITIIPPHPSWTNGYGKEVTQLNMIVLGGPNGLNA